MGSTLRNTRDLTTKIDKMQSDIIKRFQSLVDLASVNKKDRSKTVVTQFQMQTETAALIRAAEELQTLIRQLQEMWLFGQLDTLGEGKVTAETDEKAREVAKLLERLTERGGQIGGE